MHDCSIPIGNELVMLRRALSHCILRGQNKFLSLISDTEIPQDLFTYLKQVIGSRNINDVTDSQRNFIESFLFELPMSNDNLPLGHQQVWWWQRPYMQKTAIEWSIALVCEMAACEITALICDRHISDHNILRIYICNKKRFFLQISWFINTRFKTLRPRQNRRLFFRRHFQIHFLEWKCVNFNQDFTEVCSQGSN